MAIIQKLMDGVVDTLKTMWPKINTSFENVNVELAEHTERMDGQDTLIDALQTGDSGAAANAARLNSITGITHPTLKDRLDIEYDEVTTQLAENVSIQANFIIKPTDNPQTIFDNAPAGSKLIFTGGLHVHGLNSNNAILYCNKPMTIEIPKTATLKVADWSKHVDNYFELITNFYGATPISDLEFDGDGYTLGDEIRTYDIQIDGSGTFKLQIRDGYTNSVITDWQEGMVINTGTWQTLADGVQVKFPRNDYAVGYGCMICSSADGYYAIRIGNGLQLSTIDGVSIVGEGTLDMNQDNNAETNYYATVLNSGILVHGLISNPKLYDVTIINSDRSIVAYGEHTGTYGTDGSVTGGTAYPITNIEIKRTKTKNCMAGILLGHPEHRGGINGATCDDNEVDCQKTAIEPNFLLKNYTVRRNKIKTPGNAIHCWRKSENGLITDNILDDTNLSKTVVTISSPSGWEVSTKIERRNNRVLGDFKNIGETVLNNGKNTITGQYALVNGESNTVSGNHSSVNGGAFNTVSGNKSNVNAGLYNTVSSEQSAVLNGEYNVASHKNTALTGKEARTRSIFYKGHSQGKVSEEGDIQTGDFLYFAQTIDDTPRLLTLDGTSPTANNMFVLPLASVIGYKITVICSNEDTVKNAMIVFRGLVKRRSTGNTHVAENNTVISNPQNFDITVMIDNTTNSLAVRVVGQAGETIKWNARVETTEIVI